MGNQVVNTPLDIETITKDFALAMRDADLRRPQAVSLRSGRLYQPGIGPHAEGQVIQLVVMELRRIRPESYDDARTGVPYSGSRRACDLVIGQGPEWAIEVKMARPNGDNGKPDDTSIKDILSPYETDRSAISDCIKLATSGFPKHKAILIYGFEDMLGRRPLSVLIEAFETLAHVRLSKIGALLGNRSAADFKELTHPVHRQGSVFAWEIHSKT